MSVPHTACLTVLLLVRRLFADSYVLLVALLAASGTTFAQQYTIAVSRLGPADTEIVIADGRGASPRVLAAHQALDYNATFSRDGRWVVFTSERGGNADIYRVRTDGSGLEKLVDHPSFDDQAVLSPDGRSLAFVSSRQGGADIWIQDLASRRARLLVSAPSGEFRPAWSPDGSWVAFVSDRDAPRRTCAGSGATTGPGPFVIPQYSGVYIVRADGSGLRRLSTPEEVAGSPYWSADGARLLFHSAAPDQVCNGGLMFGTGTSQVVAWTVETGARETLTSGDGVKFMPRVAGGKDIAYVTRDGLGFVGRDAPIAGTFGRPDWSADGAAMVFHREVAPRVDDPARFPPRPSSDPRFALTAIPGHGSYSPDGRRVAYIRNNFGAGGVGNGVLFVADADGSNARPIFESAATDNLTGPAWSPHHDRIAFGTGAFFRRAGTGASRLATIGADGSSLTSLGDGPTQDGMPSWSPDGRSLVYRVADGDSRGLYILDIASGARRRLDTGSDRDTFPYWSPRGDWITFTSQRDGDYEIYRIRPDGSGLRRLTNVAGHDAHASVSPDGEWVAFSTSRQGFKDEALGLFVGARPPPFQAYGEIAVMRIDGSDLQLLTDNSVEEGVPVWAASGE